MRVKVLFTHIHLHMPAGVSNTSACSVSTTHLQCGSANRSSTLVSVVLHTDTFLYPEEEDIGQLCESLDIERWYTAVRAGECGPESGNHQVRPLSVLHSL